MHRDESSASRAPRPRYVIPVAGRPAISILISGARTISGFRGNTINNMAATAATQKEKEPVNIVHQNAIFCETILKEQRHQKLYTSYGVNPYKKSKQSTSVKQVLTITRKLREVAQIMLLFFIQCTCLLANQTQNMTQRMVWKMVRV